MNTRKMLVIVITVLLVGVVGYEVYNRVMGPVAPAVNTEGPRLNRVAPAFQLTGLDGTTYRVGGERDKPVLVNFWASWCGPCEMEAPDLQAMYEKYKDQLDLYGVNMTVGDRMDNIQSFLRYYNITFPILMDSEGEVGMQYRIRGIPVSYLIDRQGVVRDAFGIVEPAELEKRIKRILNED